MSQNLVQITVTDEQVAAANAGLEQLEGALTGLISLEAARRRRMNKMGPKSEVFCRQCLSVLTQNPQIVPPSLDLAAALGDLQALDRLRPIFDRLQRLAERGRDTEMALGSDAMDTALDGYKLLEVMGRHHGLEGLKKELRQRWAKSSRGKGEEEPGDEAEGEPPPAGA